MVNKPKATKASIGHEGATCSLGFSCTPMGRRCPGAKSETGHTISQADRYSDELQNVPQTKC